MQNVDQFKKQAALKAVEFVQSGMVLGLGTGSTSLYAVQEIGQRCRDGSVKSIIGIPSSIKTAHEAQQCGIPLGSLDNHPIIDLTIDGADEVDPDLNLIKGGGGALVREKIVAQNSRKVVIIIDESKLSSVLGVKRDVPIEIIPFGFRPILNYLKALGSSVKLRKTEKGLPFETDQGNYIIDCKFDRISEPQQLAGKLKEKAGIVEHGLFLGLATDVIVAGQKGIQHFSAKRKRHGI